MPQPKYRVQGSGKEKVCSFQQIRRFNRFDPLNRLKKTLFQQPAGITPSTM
jgi:hypothetical protein